MTNDVSRAYFYAPAIREVYIEISTKDWEEGDEDQVAKLDMSMYGIREAAKNWQGCYTSHLESIGFTAGVANPCFFVNHNYKLKTLVHGDDYVTTGSREGLKWMKGELEKKFKIKTSIIGSEEEDEKELKILNRIIRMTPRGIEYEADLRHAELISEEMLVSDSKGVDTPGVREDDKEGEEGERTVGRVPTWTPATQQSSRSPSARLGAGAGWGRVPQPVLAARRFEVALPDNLERAAEEIYPNMRLSGGSARKSLTLSYTSPCSGLAKGDALDNVPRS